jgi:hypothetical protein
MNRGLRNLILSALAFAGAIMLALGTSPKPAMASSRTKAAFATCVNPRPLWCAPGQETDICVAGPFWLSGCINNGGQS